MTEIYIKQSENRLVRSFVIGAFIFLIFFEGIFLASRYFLEKQAREHDFIVETEILMGRKSDPVVGIRPMRLGFVKTNPDGIVVASFIPDILVGTKISEVFGEEICENFSEKISYFQDNMVRKMPHNHETLYFFSSAIDKSIIFRDALRFLVLDLLLLIPVYLFATWYVRRVLRPVQENIDTMTHFVHDAGHELKTPLAIISGNLQIMRDSDHVEYDLIEENLATIDVMNESIQWLLELADLKIPEKNSETNLYTQIESEIQRAHNFRDVSFENTVSEKIFIKASEKHLSLLLRNLIENAIKYNQDEGKVFISYEKNTLIIEDTGIGMNEDDMKRIFDRFYRVNQNTSVSGSGIGLTLVDKVIKMYDWKIRVESQENKWTKFFITF